MRSPRLALVHRQSARSYAAQVNAIAPSQQALLARDNFDAFRWFVKKHKTYEHHHLWGQCLNTGQDSRCLHGIAGPDLLILAPRGSSKSTYLIEWVAWQIGRHAAPAIAMALKVLYVSYELKTARQKSQQIKRLLSLPEYRKVFPWIKSGENWANELWEIDSAHAGLPVADEPYTVAAAGLIGNVTGKRCFPGNTLVETEVGLLEISRVYKSIGIKILTFNELSKKLEWCELEDADLMLSSELVEIKTVKGRRLECTPGHPIYTLEDEYVDAYMLLPGDSLVVVTDSQRGDWEVDTVLSVVALYSSTQPVYDLQMKNNYNFFANGILVHNCHLAVFDDLIKSPEAIANPDIRNQMVSNHRNIIKPTRFDGARSICLGTRMRPDDIYVTEFNQENDWQVVEQSAILELPGGRERSYWEPEDERSPGQTLVFLQDIREKEPETFSYQYQNKVIRIATQAITPELIVKGLIPPSMDYMALGVDLSAGQKETNDYTTFVLGGMARDDRRRNKYYIIDCWEGRVMGNMRKLEAIAELYNCWKHLCPYLEIFVESNGYQLSFAGDYQDFVAQQEYYDWRVTMVPSRTGKLERLRGVSGLLENKLVTFNQYGRLMGKLSLQLTNWGSTAHDDLADGFEKCLSGLRQRSPLSSVS